MMSNDGLIIENMDLSRNHLAGHIRCYQLRTMFHGKNSKISFENFSKMLIHLVKMIQSTCDTELRSKVGQ